MVHDVKVVGEAASQLPQWLRDAHPEVPWAEMLGMRHVLVHGYFQVDLDIVWQVVKRDLPALKPQLQASLAQLPGG